MSPDRAIVYLIPAPLDDETLDCLPAYILRAVMDCRIFFVENERTARRYLRKLWKDMPIEAFEWHLMDEKAPALFRSMLSNGARIGILSEAGCPGIADPGQDLVQLAQQAGATVKPLVGPSSILLAIMASGLNGQQFRFNGYLPIHEAERARSVRELEAESARLHCTQVFIETPYRNNQMLQTLLKTCKPNTRICIASQLTTQEEFIKTKTVEEWKKNLPDLHKKPVIFCLLSGTGQ